MTSQNPQFFTLGRGVNNPSPSTLKNTDHPGGHKKYLKYLPTVACKGKRKRQRRLRYSQCLRKAY